MFRSTLLSLCLLASAATAGHAAVATNLVPNPHFDDHVLGWTPPNPLDAKMAFAPVDQHGKVGAGSMRIFDIAAGRAFQVGSSCFAVDPGAPVVFGAGAYAPGAPAPQDIRASLTFYDTPACVGNSSAKPNDLSVSTGSSTWGTLQGSGSVPAGKHGARLIVFLNATLSPAIEVFLDNAYVYQGITCKATDTVACLGEGRFRLSMSWEVPDGARGYGRMHAFAGATDSAYATFFDPGNVEMVVKVLDGCALNERFWVFASGLTNVETQVRIRDTLFDESWQYTNPLDEEFPPVLDTDGFETCKH